MSLSWGYSPKTEKYIPLADFPADRYLLVVLKVIENLGWTVSHVSRSGIIAYTGLSWQSYSEEISIRIKANFAIIKSECVGIQLLFNDYGKNESNLQKFFDEFEYAEFHLKDSWEQNLQTFQQQSLLHDESYFDRAPLAAKEKIKNLLYLFLPQKGYLITPILINLNILYWFISLLIFVFGTIYLKHDPDTSSQFHKNYSKYIGANNSYLTLSGDYWRLFTCIFIHSGLSHLFSNMYALTYIGLMTENKIGSKRFFVIYVLCGIVGSATSVLFHPVGFMVGASGAIMGMFGCFLALLFGSGFERNARKALLISTVLVTTLMLLSGFSKTGVDNSAHLGGLISGLALGVIFQYDLVRKNPFITRLAYLTAFISAMVFIAGILYFTPKYQVERFHTLEEEYHENRIKSNQAYDFTGKSKEVRLEQLKIYGIESWKSNIIVSGKMRSLNLPADVRKKALRMDQLARLQHKILTLLYQEAEEETGKYRGEINQLTKQMNQVLKAQREEYNLKQLSEFLINVSFQPEP